MFPTIFSAFLCYYCCVRQTLRHYPSELRPKDKEKIMREIDRLKQRIADLDKQLAECRTEKHMVTEERDLLRLLINALPDHLFIKDRTAASW
jgi:Viral A-type inclusion protein repeat